jgi:hypothetical protein
LVVDEGDTWKTASVAETPVTLSPVGVGLVQLVEELAASLTEYGGVPTASQDTVRLRVWPLSSTAEGIMVTVVPVNAELTATEASAQLMAGGVPVLLSSTFTE